MSCVVMVVLSVILDRTVSIQNNSIIINEVNA